MSSFCEKKTEIMSVSRVLCHLLQSRTGISNLSGTNLRIKKASKGEELGAGHVFSTSFSNRYNEKPVALSMTLK